MSGFDFGSGGGGCDEPTAAVIHGDAVLDCTLDDVAIRANWAGGIPGVEPLSQHQVALSGPGSSVKGDGAGVFAGLSLTAQSRRAVAVGGDGGTALAENSAVVGGKANRIEAAATAAGILAGTDNRCKDVGQVIVGGSQNNGESGGDNAVVAGGTRNTVQESRSAVVGGDQNAIGGTGQNGAIVGGSENDVLAAGGFIGGGQRNTINAGNGAVVGGFDCVVNGVHALATGLGSLAGDDMSFACAGGQANIGTPGTFAHGSTGMEQVGFRGVAPATAPSLLPLIPTGNAALDAVIQGLVDQGLAQ